MRGRAQGCFDTHLWARIAENMTNRLVPMTHPFQDLCDLSLTHTPGLEDFLPTHWQGVDYVRYAQTTYNLVPNTFDLILSPLRLHWSENPQQDLITLYNALKPGGLLIATFWGGDTLSELRNALAEADFNVSGRVSPRIIPMMRLEDATALLASTPFLLPAVDYDDMTFVTPSLHTLGHYLRNLGEGNALAERPTKLPPKAFWSEVHRLYPKKKAEELHATFHLLTLTGWKQGPGLPTSLKPRFKTSSPLH